MAYPSQVGEEGPSRSISAPPALDSHMLFAFPVTFTQSGYANAFSDIRNDQSYEEFYEKYNQYFTIPPPLNDPHHLEKAVCIEKARRLSTISDQEEERSRSNSFLTKELVETVIKEEDSGFPQSVLEVPEFSPSFPQPVFNFTSEQYYTHAYEMAKDQAGCRLLQQKIEEASAFEISVIYDQIFSRIPELIMHPFGNYLCQKIFEYIDQSCIISIINLISPQVTNMCLDTHGTRSIQKLISVVKIYPQHIQALLAPLKTKTALLIKDTNANHVIQRVLSEIGPPQDQFIFEAATSNLLEIATHKHGCCVIQRCLDSGTEEQRQGLINSILKHCVQLVQDAFGNYVVQYVLDFNNSLHNANLARVFVKHIRLLATQKFSSNVIEKCLQQNSEEVQAMMIKEIGHSEMATHLICDQYGNYVVQRALMLASPSLRSFVVKEIKKNAEKIKANNFGQRILGKLTKKYPEFKKRK